MRTEEWTIEPQGQEVFTALRLHPNSPVLVIGNDQGKIIFYNLKYREKIHVIQNFEETPFGDRVLIVSPVRDISIDTERELVYIFMYHGMYQINLSGFDIQASIPTDEEVIAGTVSYQFKRLGYITVSGLVSVWNLGVEFNIGDYQLPAPPTSCKISLIAEDEVVVTYQDGTVTTINITESYHQTVKNYSNIDYMLKSYYYDDNDDYYVTITDSGSIRVVQRVKSIERRSAKSLSNYFQDTTASTKKSLRQVINNSRKIPNLSFFISDLKENYKIGEMERIVNKTNLISRISKDRYEALVHGMEKSKDAEINEIIKDESPEITLSQAIETYIQFKNSKTRNVLKQVCMVLGLDPKITILAWNLNYRRAEGLINYSRRLKELQSKRNSQRLFLIITAYIALFSSVLMISFLSDSQIIVITEFSLLISSIILLTIYRRNNKNPRIPYVYNWKMFWIFGFFSSISIIIVKVLSLFEVIDLL